MNDFPWTEDAARALLGAALNATGGGEAEATLGGGSLALTRFANNRIHQNVREEWPVLGLRVLLRGPDGVRVGHASTGRIDERGLRRLAEDAQALAKVSAPVPDAPALAGEANLRAVDAWDPRAADAGPALRADRASRIVLPARKAGLTAAGTFAVHRMSLGDYADPGLFSMANTQGLFAYHRRTRVECGCTLMTDDSSGWARADDWSYERVDPDALATRAIDKALRSRSPKGLAPGPTTVVLEPEAVASLLGFLLGAFSAQAVQEGRSLLTGKLGQKLFPDSVRLEDDCFHPLHRGRPFDGEGIPTRRVPLITDGTAAGLVYSRQEADVDGVEPTGHGPQQPSTEGSHPRFPVLAGGQSSMDDLIREAGEGVLVTRLWYNRMVDSRKVRVTGMTRDGTFRIRKGKLAEGLRNLRYNVAVPELLRAVVAATAPERAGGMVVPALLVRGFPFTSATRF